MNYYPANFYSNYQYGQQYPQYNTAQAAAASPSMMQSSIQSQNPLASMIQGKLVENEDMVKITDIPLGGYGVFPKADMSEVYIKTWNNNGTTSITTFVPIPLEETKEEKEKSRNELILNKINSLEEKIDSIISQKQSPVNTNATTTVRKELDTNAY